MLNLYTFASDASSSFNAVACFPAAAGSLVLAGVYLF
jgi:hypothetical protein